MNKRHLPQIKLFKIAPGYPEVTDIEINAYVVQCFNETGNEPIIKHSGEYISVMVNRLVEVAYKAPERAFSEVSSPKRRFI